MTNEKVFSGQKKLKLLLMDEIVSVSQKNRTPEPLKVFSLNSFSVMGLRITNVEGLVWGHTALAVEPA